MLIIGRSCLRCYKSGISPHRTPTSIARKSATQKNRHVDFRAQDSKRLRPVQHCVRSQIRRNWHTRCRSPLSTPEAVRPRDGNACVLVHSISAGICRTFLRRAIVRIYFSDHARTGGVIDACIETARLDDDSVVGFPWACGEHVRGWRVLSVSEFSR